MASSTARRPPILPMLAKTVDALPQDDFLFEPKWDGFRALALRDATRS